MANVFGILTAIVLALSAFLAYKNKAAYQDRINQTNDEKDRLKVSEQRFTTAVNNVNDTSKELADTNAESARLTEEGDKRKDLNDGLVLQIETKTAEVNNNKTQLDAAREVASQFSDVRELTGQMSQVRTEIEELAQSVTATEAKLANLTANNNQAEIQATTIRTRLDTLTSGRSLPTASTRIRSIYPGWGFVTLASGNNAGIVANSTLDIVRGGEVIGKLLVTAVESSSASASIVPDSIAEDTVLMVGDQVSAPTAD